MASMDWNWWAFKEGAPDQTESSMRVAHAAGFQEITRLSCQTCEHVRYYVWVFTGSGSGAPTQAERMLAAIKELGDLLFRQCPDHQPVVKKV